MLYNWIARKNVQNSVPAMRIHPGTRPLPNKEEVMFDILSQKLCRKCGEWKDKEKFYKTPKNKDGLRSWCKQCTDSANSDWRKKNKKRMAQYHSLWRKANPDKYKATQDRWWKKNSTRRRADNLKRLGATIEQYKELFVKQNGTCAICGTNNPGRRQKNFAVDHNHKSGKVRGLLCFSCNAAIGMFGDRSDIIHRAANYLEENE